MSELPLFPLNTVLFPGAPIQLHIFEERYQQMMDFCITERQPFGVVLIAEGSESRGPLARPHMVGCAAHIQQVEPLPDGRMNLLAYGKERFQIHALGEGKPYLTGEVTPFPLIWRQSPQLSKVQSELATEAARYIRLLSKAGEVDTSAINWPDDVESLTYLAAHMLRISAAEKQKLLAQEDAYSLMRLMLKLYRQEVSVMQTMPGRSQGVFSFN